MRIKRNILLTAAILLIIVALYSTISAILAIAEHDYDSFYAGTYNILNAIICPIGIVIGVLVCMRYNKPSFFLNISAVAGTSLILLLLVIFTALGVDMGAGIYFGLPLGLVMLGVFIAGIVVKDDVIVRPWWQSAPAESPIKNDREKNIELLNKLKAEGQITEEEYKKLLMKELEK